MLKLAILISGFGSNMQKIAHACIDGKLKNHFEVAAVISNRLNAEGLEKAKELGIKTFVCKYPRDNFEYEVSAIIKNLKIDYIILAGFMKILGEKFVSSYPQKIINIHPADTKLHQGLGAYEWAYQNKLEETSITIHYVDKGVDTGPIILQKKVDLKGVNSLDEVKKRGLKIEHIAYPQALLKICSEGENPCAASWE